jgi:hypothetical protein
MIPRAAVQAYHTPRFHMQNSSKDVSRLIAFTNLESCIHFAGWMSVTKRFAKYLPKSRGSSADFPFTNPWATPHEMDITYRN